MSKKSNHLKYEHFNDYFENVIDNVSERILTDEDFKENYTALREFIHDLYFKEIPDVKATLVIESLFTHFRHKLNNEQLFQHFAERFRNQPVHARSDEENYDKYIQNEVDDDE